MMTETHHTSKINPPSPPPKLASPQSQLYAKFYYLMISLVFYQVRFVHEAKEVAMTTGK